MYLTVYTTRKIMTQIFDQFSDLHQARMRGKGRERDKEKKTDSLKYPLFHRIPINPQLFSRSYSPSCSVGKNLDRAYFFPFLPSATHQFPFQSLPSPRIMNGASPMHCNWQNEKKNKRKS